VILALSFALLAIYGGESLGQRLRPNIVRVVYNWAFLFALTAAVDMLLTGKWASLNALLQ
jgi:hypothetical protein